MASDLDTVTFICDQSGLAARLSHRRMFGEYAIYLDGKVVAFVCDNQLFLKPTDAGRALLGSPTEAPPYPGGRNHFLLQDELDDPPRLRQAFEVTAAALPLPKPKPKPVRTPAVAATRKSPAARRSRPKPGG